MLNRQEFTETIIGELREQLSGDYNIVQRQVMKANDTPYTAINMTKEGSDIGIVLYAEDMYSEYESGRSIEEIAEKAADRVRSNSVEKEVLPSFDRDFILGNVYFRMANAAMNQRRFENIPIRVAQGTEDIALYPCVDVSIRGTHGITMISESAIQSLGISVEELHSAAQANTERRVEVVPLSQLLAEMMPGMSVEAFDSPFYVTRDREAKDGVGCASIFGAPEALKQMEGDYYIIPSSVHEVLLLPKSFEADTDRLHELVHEVNRDVLQPEDFLSDHVYEMKAGAVSTVGHERAAEKSIELE